MFAIHTHESALPYVLLAVSTAALAIRYGHTQVGATLERTIRSRLAKRACKKRSLCGEQCRMILDLSHGLQTPLAVLKGRIEGLERNMIHEGGGTGLLESIESLSGFVNELLALASLEQSLEGEAWETFSLSRLMHAIAEECGVIAGADGIRLSASIASDVIFFGNEKRMREAVMNLVANSIKYMGEGAGKEIRLSLVRERARIRVEVADTGMGIAEADLPRIFDRFYRGSMQRYGTVPGTGLGLSISKRIVEEHGGEIGVRSEVRRGTAVTLTFPYKKRGRSRTRLP